MHVVGGAGVIALARPSKRAVLEHGVQVGGDVGEVRRRWDLRQRIARRRAATGATDDEGQNQGQKDAHARS